MGEGDLDVQGKGEDVADEDKCDAERPSRDAAPEEEVAEEVPVAKHEPDLRWPSPRSGTEVLRTGRQEMQPGENVEIEAGDEHGGVIGVLLVPD